MPVIGLANQKGGVGKTTLSLHIAAALAMSQERPHILLIDADPQHSSLDWAAVREGSPVFSCVGMPHAKINRELEDLKRTYDWIIIDGPPRVNDVSRAVVIASDLVLVPIAPSGLDVWASSDAISTINEALVYKPNLKVRFLVNRVQPNTKVSADVTDAIKKYEILELGARVHHRIDFAASISKGLTVFDLGTRSAKAATLDINSVVLEVAGIVGATVSLGDSVHA